MKIGLQTNVWSDDQHQNDLSRLLAGVARAGYAGFEIGAQRVNLRQPAHLRRLTTSKGLLVAGIHTHGRPHDPGWTNDAMGPMGKAADFAASVGAAFLAFSGKPHPGESEAELALIARTLDRVGRLCRQAGVVFCYHNHYWELEADGHELGYIVDHSDPENVSLLLDLGWVVRAGGDPVAVIERFKARIGAVHLKDTTADGNWCDLGQGIVDFAAVMPALLPLALPWALVERDEPLAAAEASAAACRRYLRRGFEL